MTTRTAFLRLILLAGVAPACVQTGADPLHVAVRGIAVDLAFEDRELVEPVEPRVIVQIVPTPPEVIDGQIDLGAFATRSPVRPFEAPSSTCPAARADAVPNEPATVNLTGQLRAGRYPRHNTGSVQVEGGAVELTLPYPSVTSDLVSEIRTIGPPSPQDRANDVLGDTEPQPEDPEGELTEWTVRTEVTAEVSITNTYRHTGSAIALVQRETVTPQETAVFVPNPPIDVIQLNRGAGHSWRSSGVDTARRMAMQIEGAIEIREPVDICGVLVDSFKVVATETIVDLETGETSGTNEPNVNHFATQLGGLILRTEQHYTETQRDPSSGAPIRVTYDFVSTLDTITPEPVE